MESGYDTTGTTYQIYCNNQVMLMMLPFLGFLSFLAGSIDFSGSLLDGLSFLLGGHLFLR